MKITLDRNPSSNGWTQGHLKIDGKHACYTCEDVVRTGPKIYGKTAIPADTYQVIITQSPRFGRRLPLLIDVPGFTGIRIHPGNTAADTEGCILPGRGFLPTGVTQSVQAFNPLFALIDAALLLGEDVTIEIRDPEPRS